MAADSFAHRSPKAMMDLLMDRSWNFNIIKALKNTSYKSVPKVELILYCILMNYVSIDIFYIMSCSR